jgi:aspartate aminotransferase
VAALDGDQSCVRQMCREFQQRHDSVQPLLDAIPGISCRKVEGAFYLFADVTAVLQRRTLGDDVAFCEQLLEATGVALVPGSAFGAPGFVRISFAASLETLHAAVERIRQFAVG